MVSEFKAEVLENERITPTVVRVRFSLPDGFDFKPGQYLSVSRVNEEGKKLRTPYSIASTPESDFGEFCVKIVDNGKASRYISTLKKGDEIELFGPLGRFVLDESSMDKDLVFVSNGTGITPFLSMIPHILENGFKNKIILISGFRNEEEILYEELFSELAEKYDNFEFHNVLSQPKNENYGLKGYVQDFLWRIVPGYFEGHFYLCGLSDMIDSVKEKLKEKGVEDERVFYERYD